MKRMKREEVDLFEKVQSQLEGLYTEMSVLSKKNPNDGVNKFKIKYINNLLTQANEILGKKYIPFDDFGQFDEDELPSNSDTAFILMQYLNCLEKLRCDCIIQDYAVWYWMIDGKQSNVKTPPPKKLKK